MDAKELDELLKDMPGSEKLPSIPLDNATGTDAEKLKEFRREVREVHRVARRIQTDSIESASRTRLTR